MVLIEHPTLTFMDSSGGGLPPYGGGPFLRGRSAPLGITAKWSPRGPFLPSGCAPLPPVTVIRHGLKFSCYFCPPLHPGQEGRTGPLAQRGGGGHFAWCGIIMAWHPLPIILARHHPGPIIILAYYHGDCPTGLQCHYQWHVNFIKKSSLCL